MGSKFIDTGSRAIRKILSGRAVDEEWAWTQEENGEFSIRSAYHLMASMQLANQAAGSHEEPNYCWRKL
jgi:hypothetical protein